MKYIPVAVYTIGICHYGHKNDPYKTVEVKADSKELALSKIRESGIKGITETVCIVKVEPNPENIALLKSRGLL